MNASERRRQAAQKYRPTAVDLLLVAEAPPDALDRYFYFEDVPTQDSLFRYVAKLVLGLVPARCEKATALSALKERGVFLIDLCEDPLPGRSLCTCTEDLVRRAKSLAPRKIILIKTTVYDAAFEPLRRAGLPVVAERIPFPGSGQQRRFEAAFARALKAANGS
ncbi:MAG: hypothetical protein ACRDLM_06465 [Gaiellaceae bacterium]